MSRGGALGDDPPAPHRHQMVGEAARLVEVVEHRDDRPALVPQPGEQPQQLVLVGQVEEGGGLVEQQVGGLLGQHHGDPHPLALAAGQLLDAPVGQFGDAGGRHRLDHGPLVRRGPGGQQRLVRVAAAGHQLPHQRVLGRRQPLREEAELAGGRLGAQGVQVLAVPPDGPGVRGKEPDEGLEQGRLAAGVGAHYGGERAVGYLQTEARGDHPVAVGEFEGVGSEAGHGGGFFLRVRGPRGRTRRGAGPVGAEGHRRTSRRSSQRR